MIDTLPLTIDIYALFRLLNRYRGGVDFGQIRGRSGGGQGLMMLKFFPHINDVLKGSNLLNEFLVVRYNDECPIKIRESVGNGGYVSEIDMIRGFIDNQYRRFHHVQRRKGQQTLLSLRQGPDRLFHHTTAP